MASMKIHCFILILLVALTQVQLLGKKALSPCACGESMAPAICLASQPTNEVVRDIIFDFSSLPISLWDVPSSRRIRGPLLGSYQVP